MGKALAPRDFLVKDYELKVGYLTQQFDRMWTRFNYCVGIESALIGGKCQLGAEGVITSRTIPIGIVVPHWTPPGRCSPREAEE